MKIAYVSREFGPITGGGIGTYIANVTRHMAARGHEIYLLTDCFTPDTLHYLPPGVKLVAPDPTLPDRIGCYFTTWHEYADRVYATLRRLHTEERLDVIEFADFGAEGFTIARAKRLYHEFAEVRLVAKLHTPTSLIVELDMQQHLNAETLINCWAEDYSVRWADLVTSPSASLGEYFQKRLGLETIYRSPYPLQLKAFAGEREFTDQKIRRVIYMGGIQVRKGVDFFIEAAKAVLAQDDSFVFEIYGKDTPTAPFGRSYTSYLKKRIPGVLKDKIVFKGPVPYERVPATFQNGCFAVFPSRWENWPNVCLEAMSLGNVVIGSRNGGMAEMIEDGVSGFLVDPYRPEEIARAILDNYQNPARLQEISRAARQRIEVWTDPNAACAQIEECYDRPVPSRPWSSGETPKVSVVVPLYNQGEYLQEALDSALASNYPNLELVVVNDGSTDPATNRLFDGLEGNGLVKVAKTNGGLSQARNAGIRASSGQYIIPLDSDDRLDKDFILRAVECLQNNLELDYLGCYTKYFGTESSTYLPIGYVPGVTDLLNTLGSCTKMFRREVFEAVGYYDEEMPSYEDWELYMRLEEQGYQSEILPEVYFYYRRKVESMITSFAFPNSGKLTQYILNKRADGLSKADLLTTQQVTLDLWRKAEYGLWENVLKVQRLWAELEQAKADLARLQPTVLPDAHESPIVTVHLPQESGPELVSRVRRRLGVAESGPVVLVKSQNGHEAERLPDGRPFQWIGHALQMQLVANGHFDARLEFVAWSLIPDNHLEVQYGNGQFEIFRLSGGPQPLQLRLRLRPGRDNRITFTSAKPAVYPPDLGINDRRMLAFAIGDMQLRVPG